MVKFNYRASLKVLKEMVIVGLCIIAIFFLTVAIAIKLPALFFWSLFMILVILAVSFFVGFIE